MATNGPDKLEIKGDNNIIFLGNADDVAATTGGGKNPANKTGGNPGAATAPPTPKVKTDALPSPLTGFLFGREDELALLDEAWANPKSNLLVFHAMGGAGKSALVSKWLDNLRKENYREATRVFGWSFFSQGSAENRADSSETFLDKALAWFGAKEAAESNYDLKAERLAELLRRERALLILDGLEPLQYPPNSAGLREGGLKDRPVQSLLDALAAQQTGLCVVTSREKLSDLTGFGAPGVAQHSLDKLSVEAGVRLLRALDVTGDDAELAAAVAEFAGHAYALTLLGSYLAVAMDGDIRRQRDIANLFQDDRYGSQAEAMLGAYEHWLAGPKGDVAGLAILRMLGLFNRPADAAAIQVLRGTEIPGLTAGLQGLSEDKWKQALARLRRINLLAAAKPGTAQSLDAHPLVREYFKQQLKANHADAWREANGRLYEHYKQAAPEFPETMDAMAPLYAAVAHGCEAGRHQEALDDVYQRRILRGDGRFSWKKLGTFSADLAAVSGFFVTLWGHPIPDLNEVSKAFLLNYAGFYLRALGRLLEAAPLLKAGLEANIAQEDWKNAAIATGNLSELYLSLGDVTLALNLAQRSVGLADKSDDLSQSVVKRTKLASTLHKAGRLIDAEDIFRNAETMQRDMKTERQLLYSLPGFLYCEFLLGQGRHTEVKERAAQSLEWVKSENWLLNIALDNLSLGWAWLRETQAAGGDDYTPATEFLNQAVNGLRQAGQMDHLPRGLLARAELWRVTGEWARAQRDVDEAARIATRGGMKLHLTDARLEQARLSLAQGDLARARVAYDEARQLVEKTGYHRRDAEVAELAAALGEEN